MRRDAITGDEARRYLRVRSVARMLDCHPATVWRLVQQGKLPRPHKLSAGITAWRLDEIEAALEQERA